MRGPTLRTEQYGNPLYLGAAATPLPAFPGFQQNPVWSPAASGGAGFQTPHPASSSGRVAAADLDNMWVEDHFATILETSLSRGGDTVGILTGFAGALESRANELREERSRSHQTMRMLKLQQQEQELDAEAASWKLLAALHGIQDPSYPGGPPLKGMRGYGGAMPTRQRAASLLASDLEVNRLARVVSWLEDLASNALDREEAALQRAGGARLQFSEREGLPFETSEATQQRGSKARQDLVTELDPDAATRQSRQWAPGDAKNTQRIVERVWQLVRAGRTSEACDMCRQCGQPWRAAALGKGPTAVGVAAEQEALDAQEGAADAQEAVAAEVDLGGNALRAMWRLTCHQAADLLVKENACEAAVFGILGGNLRCVMPLCSTWHDKLWAESRCWLEASLDKELCPAKPSDNDGLNRQVIAAAEEFGRQKAASESLSVLDARWPAKTLSDQAPMSWPAVESRLGRSTLGNSSQGFEERQRAIQWRLIQGPEADDYLQLLLHDIPACLPQEVVPSELSPEQARTLRFCAHLGLALADLGIIPAQHLNDVPQQLLAIQAKMDRILEDYLTHLLSKGQYKHTPFYACRLKPEARRRLCCALLLHLTKQGSLEVRQTAVEDLDHWFSFWRDEQLGDVQPDELHAVLDLVAQESRWDTKAGPMMRAESAAWLWFSYTTLPQAVSHTNALLRELALGGEAAHEAALLLLSHLPAETKTLLGRGVPEIESCAWMEELLQDIPFGPEQASVIKDDLLQLYAWNSWFEIKRLYKEWQDHADSIEGDVGAASSRENAQDLLGSFLGFLTDCDKSWLPALELAQPPPPESEALEIKILACLEQNTRQYCSLDVATAKAVANEIDKQIQACISIEEADSFDIKVSAEQGRADSEQAFIHLEAAADSPAALARATSLLALALKGHLRQSGPNLKVVNLYGSTAAQLQLCKSIVYPDAILKAMRLRETLVRAGKGLGVGVQVIHLAAGITGASRYMGLTEYFSPQELQALVEIERQALVAHELLMQTEPLPQQD